MKKSEIITAIIATYGAVLSTITILRQYFGDRIKVTVTVGKNRQVVGDPRYQNMTLTVITVTNIGKRPVTITTFGAIGLHPHRSMVAVDTRPVLPCELTEGRYVTSMWDQNDLNFSTIDYWAAWDSRGKIHKVREASRFNHMKSVLLQRVEWSRKKKKTNLELP
jgi:hypothetical protein